MMMMMMMMLAAPSPTLPFSPYPVNPFPLLCHPSPPLVAFSPFNHVTKEWVGSRGSGVDADGV